MIPLLANAMYRRPWKMAKYATVAYLFQAAMYALDDEADEDEERRALPEHLQGRTIHDIPKAIRLWGRDYNGDPLYFDISRKVPGGDILETRTGSAAMPIPKIFQMGRPILMAAEFMTNTVAFTGKKITDSLTDTNAEKAVKG